MTAPTNPEELVDLLPCPFCGGGAGFGERSYKSSRKSGVQHGFTANCMKLECLATVAGLESFDTKEQAAAAWNTRAAIDATPLVEMRDALRLLVETPQDSFSHSVAISEATALLRSLTGDRG